ncbi:TetR/AcrR family transcriptional regulator [Microaerobacter geothermalis]|uniref:TetR/AcrR family transcriptional regulator n=1 Tax=Microaerobacter geothermalis TaxID=674972 RepID=UPI001F42E1A2|nr:TetR/AcrR family transcriptional regulator [Microaerobacter geothermalis]MCF6092812.1 TetR/AcrR family transcriptional regulator [Microaerobacter geothermalis]
MSEKTIQADGLQMPLTKKGAKTRQKLLDTAEKVFGRKGYFNASVVDITQQANVAQGTFYNYFSSKLEIFEALVKQLSQDFRNQIRSEVANARNFEEAQRIGFRTFFQWVKNHRDLYSIVQQAVLVDEELYRRYYERIASGYIKGIEEAIGQKEIQSFDPETVAYCLMGISQFIGMRWVYWENQDVPDRVFNDMMNFIFKGLSRGRKNERDCLLD